MRNKIECPACKLISNGLALNQMLDDVRTTNPDKTL